MSGLHNLIADGIARQKRAADPESSVWVSASAGSGKTRVLVERCLRLMLNGTRPERLLCITFTKAAAAEMANRLNETLGAWSVMSEEELTQNLHELMDRAPEDIERLRARRLFASVLDAPGGLKIQTIHAFCQSVLGRFPLEAGLAPNFEVMDERTADEILDLAKEEMLLDLQEAGNDVLIEDLLRVSAEANEESFKSLLTALSGKRSALFRLLHDHGDVDGIITALSQKIGIDPAVTEDEILSFACDEGSFDGHNLRRAVAVLARVATSKTATEKAEVFAAWLSAPEDRVALYPAYLGVFLTAKGTIQARLATKAAVEAYPEILDVMTAEAERLQAVEADIRRVRVLANSAALIRVGIDLLRRFEEEKRRRGKLDYDDLILKTRDLLTSEGVTPWVMYKLDGGIEHILVDEAQDTSALQWQVIAALAAEFFAGEGAVETRRTLFVVGDEKQSIYSFQGADPAAFDVMRHAFQEQAEAAAEEWRNVPLDLSFRSTRAVLELVDRVFEEGEVRAGLTAEGSVVRHLVRRAEEAGLVEIWPTVKPPEEEASDPWDIPAEQGQDAQPAARLARNIATQIRHWLDTREILAAKGRPIRPRDIMILVQSRGPFFAAIVRALKLVDIPVGGADRMVLTEQLAVMDLMALARFVLLPEDDLNLAVVLKGPFVGCDDNQLFELAYGRKGSLWRALREDHTGLSVFAEGLKFLRDLLARADFVPVYEFFADILGRLRGREKLLRRLGQEAADPIEEFLSRALDYQRREATSLQAFLHWIEAGAAEVKRDMEQGRDEVRVLTVHGSKGLQAPIVFLPDTCRGAGKGPSLFWTEEEDTSLPLWPVRVGNDDPLTGDAREKEKLRATEERKRLLYVALTRAEDRLYICGWESKKARPKDCWYELIDPAFGEGVEEVALPFGEVGRRRSTGKPAEIAPVPEIAAEIAPAPLPAWLPAPAPVEPSPPRPLTPSRDEEEEPPVRSPLGRDDGARFRRGLLIHRLLEILPDMPAEKRETAARAWLARPVHALEPERQAELLRETMAVLDHPEFAAIFGPGSQAEVPLSGVFGDQVMSGQMDRLLVGEKEVLIIDYKTNRPSPHDPARVPKIYLRQMAAYARALERIYPGKAIKCALLWTDEPHLMVLPNELL
ncbi:MAG: double-strand break repair helicase AddA [Alphaproteobacteria bacterium]|nr:MAG: double-strand break repair helicase AddA [Alphaproteobacteria bacterium]